MPLRYYQQACVDHAQNWAKTAQRGDHITYAAPTGSGKSYAELELQKLLSYWIITPRLEIARGLFEKRGHDPQSLSDLVECCWREQIVTPIRFRNALFRGDIKSVPGIIFDEGHHAPAESWREVWLACGMPPVILFTATPYRRTSRATSDFIRDWGEPIWMIKIQEAVAQGFISLPSYSILPLVDDDLITVGATGEFEIESLESETLSRLEHAAKEISRYCDNGNWDRVTVVTVPTQNIAKELKAKVPGSEVITAKTPDTERRVIFELLKLRRRCLIQIAVVGEGIDLPIRRLIDLAPTLSPVRWMQQLGRCTRPVEPGEAAPEYICTNRNLARHAYLLEGLVPSAKVAEASEAFGGPSQRAGYRALGLECLGRFKAVNVKLLDGNHVQLYLLTDTSNGRMTEFASIVHPCIPDPIWAQRHHTATSDVLTRGTWKRCEAPQELRGFVSQSPYPPSPKMQAWWEKAAEFKGLDPDVRLTRKNFAILPILTHLGLSFKCRSR